jgi:hypothetical protein
LREFQKFTEGKRIAVLYFSGPSCYAMEHNCNATIYTADEADDDVLRGGTASGNATGAWWACLTRCVIAAKQKKGVPDWVVLDSLRAKGNIAIFDACLMQHKDDKAMSSRASALSDPHGRHLKSLSGQTATALEETPEGTIVAYGCFDDLQETRGVSVFTDSLLANLSTPVHFLQALKQTKENVGATGQSPEERKVQIQFKKPDSNEAGWKTR